MKMILFFCGILLLTLPAIARQNTRPTLDILQLMERLFPIQGEDLDYEALYELLLEIYQNPLEINRVTADELQATYLLSPPQIQALLFLSKLPVFHPYPKE
jgi:hypothetical protein